VREHSNGRLQTTHVVGVLNIERLFTHSGARLPPAGAVSKHSGRGGVWERNQRPKRSDSLRKSVVAARKPTR
jgi:hypothetical protein